MSFVDTLREKIISNGVKNLKAYGYAGATKQNILTDEIYSEFFRSMLSGNLGKSKDSDEAINSILKELP